jgi:2,4-dienoyl-CoA reductase-like NADH-dependent reductase (Old Yellow Enzyme family)
VLKDLGASYFHIAAEGGNWARECLYADGQSSNGIAKKLTGVPIIANGGLHNTLTATSLISSNQTDLISIGKAAIANPNWANLIAAGQPTIPFFSELIKPSLTLQHTNAVLKQCESA